jgi:FkbM family methyltransferase
MPVPPGVSLARLPQRLEEVVAFVALRSNPHYYTNNAFLGAHTMLSLLHGRHPIYLDTRGADVAPHIMMFGMWEPNYTRLFQRLIRPGDTVFDIGAQLGVYSLLGSASTGPTGKLHAFEPNARFAALLKRSLSVNGFTPFAQLHNVAVGAETGTAKLRFSWELAGGGHLNDGLPPKPAGQEEQTCRLVALDDLFRDEAFTVDVIKMDVEGSEAKAVRGMRRLLARSPRVRIMFEFSPEMLAAHGSSAAELIGQLDELGMRFWSIRNDSSLDPVQASELSAKADGIVNILAARGDPFA